MRVGYVPQKLSIDWTLPLPVHRFMDMTSPVSRQEALAAMAATGVEHLADKEVRHLSGGEFQRVLLARAMARKPDLLVLDEPVQGVDFAGEIALYDLIRQIRDDTNCGILLISHDLHVVMAANRPGHLPQWPCLLFGYADRGGIKRRIQGSVRCARGNDPGGL